MASKLDKLSQSNKTSSKKTLLSKLPGYSEQPDSRLSAVPIGKPMEGFPFEPLTEKKAGHITVKPQHDVGSVVRKMAPGKKIVIDEPEEQLDKFWKVKVIKGVMEATTNEGFGPEIKRLVKGQVLILTEDTAVPLIRHGKVNFVGIVEDFAVGIKQRSIEIAKKAGSKGLEKAKSEALKQIESAKTPEGRKKLIKTGQLAARAAAGDPIAIVQLANKVKNDRAIGIDGNGISVLNGNILITYFSGTKSELNAAIDNLL